jgi:hypothetical protein
VEDKVNLPRLRAAARKIPGLVPFLVGLPRCLRPIRPIILARNLRRLNDVLASTGLAGRYWIWGGLLLGWARNGEIISHDAQDADFAYLVDDAPLFYDAARALVANGFKPFNRFCNNEGHPTEYCFKRQGVKFEFFEVEPVGASLHYYMYGRDEEGVPVQAKAKIPNQPLEQLRLCRRTWLKHANHEAELTAHYGDWKTPNYGWWYLDQLDIYSKEKWLNIEQQRWHGDLRISHGAGSLD